MFHHSSSRGSKYTVRKGALPTFETRYEYKKNHSGKVLLVGLLLVVIVVIFITKHAGAAGLLLGIVPGNPFDESQHDDDLWRVFLGIVGVIVLGLLPFTVF